jgi:CHASE2 domain-containing sensor protein
VNLKAITEWNLFRPAMGAALAVLCGLILWGTPMGDFWENASYDYQFRFGSRAVSNQVMLIQMDNGSYRDLHQERYSAQKPDWQPWDRNLHAQLLKRLAEGGASLVVMEIFSFDTTTPRMAALWLRPTMLWWMPCGSKRKLCWRRGWRRS